MPPRGISGPLQVLTSLNLEVKVAQSCPTLCDSMGYNPWNSPGQNSGVGSLSLLQEISPTQGLNPGLPHCGQILYQLSYKGSPRIWEWVAYPFSRGSSRLRNQTWSLLHCRRILYFSFGNYNSYASESVSVL